MRVLRALILVLILASGPVALALAPKRAECAPGVRCYQGPCWTSGICAPCVCLQSRPGDGRCVTAMRVVPEGAEVLP